MSKDQIIKAGEHKKVTSGKPEVSLESQEVTVDDKNRVFARALEESIELAEFGQQNATAIADRAGITVPGEVKEELFEVDREAEKAQAVLKQEIGI